MSVKLKGVVDASRLISNAKAVKSLLNKKVKLCAVIKSNAYGHGLIKTAEILYDYCDYFAVSLASEVYNLRVSGIDKPILLLTPSYEENVEKLLRYKATLSVGSVGELILIKKTAKKLGEKASVHIALNSGMNRIGFSTKEEVLSAVNYIKKNNKYISLNGAFSHLANPKNKKQTNSQFLNFKSLIEPIKSYNSVAVIHLLSSGGALKYSNMQLDMVRVGILLYGYKPLKSNKITVKPALTVYAKRVIKRNGLYNKFVLYGRQKCPYDGGDILRLGYADGFKRNKTFKINCCMDLSLIKKEKGSKNSYIKIMDNAQTLAKKYKTITYEVLVNSTIRADIEYKNYAYNRRKT